MAEIDQQLEDGKKSKKKLIIIILIVVVLLGGGAAGYFFFYAQSDVKEETAEEPEEKAEAEKHEILYYDLAKPFIVDFSRKSPVRLIQINLAFKVEDKATMEAMKKHEPMIRNNVLMLLSAVEVESLFTREGKEKLRADILTEVRAIMEKMIGTNKVNEVFFTSFVMQ